MNETISFENSTTWATPTWRELPSKEALLVLGDNGLYLSIKKGDETVFQMVVAYEHGTLLLLDPL